MDGGSYPLPAALKVIGITESTATNWTKRGYAETAIAPSGRGRPRQLSVIDIIRLAIMKALADLGVAPTRSADWAAVAMNWMSTLSMMTPPKQTGSIYIRTYPDGEVTVMPDPGLIERQPRPGAEAVIQLNLRAIIARVRDQLAAIKVDD